MKIFKINKTGSLGITLPKNVCKAIGWEVSDKLGYKLTFSKDGTPNLLLVKK